jgi:hypothetical protein
MSSSSKSGAFIPAKSTIADIDRTVSYLRHQASKILDGDGGDRKLAKSMMLVASDLDAIAESFVQREALRFAEVAKELGGLTTDCVASWSDGDLV